MIANISPKIAIKSVPNESSIKRWMTIVNKRITIDNNMSLIDFIYEPPPIIPGALCDEKRY